MDPDPQRIQEDLRGLLQGDVLCDEVPAQLYATDASIYELRPLGVIRPRSVDDVTAAIRYAAENNLPIHARGAGTGLAGESLGGGLVIDFSRHMRRILAVEEGRVRVQPGVVLATLNRFLHRRGQLFGPDPAMRSVTTMGSVVAIDAGGSHWPRYGSARRHVEELQIVLTDGTTHRVSRHATAAVLKPTSHGRGQGEGALSKPLLGNGDTPDPAAERLQEIVTAVAGLIRRHAHTINEERPQTLVNRSGYQLHDVLAGDQLDLAKLLVGSEGTLALITEATLTIDPLPTHRGCAVLLFDSLEKAAHAAIQIAELRPTACDFMDRRHLNLARETDVRYELLIPGEAEAMLLVEQHAETSDELNSRIDEIVDLAVYKTGLAAAAHIAEDETDFQLFWGLAQRFVPTLHQLQGTNRPTPCIEDIAVPVESLPVFLRHLQDTLKRLQVTASVFGHAAQGQLHIRPLLDLDRPSDIRTMESLAIELYEKVWALNGTISGEHADGLSRTPFLARQYGPLTNVFRELKQIFDPHSLLNPGKKVPLTPTRMTQNLRRTTIQLQQPESLAVNFPSPPGGGAPHDFPSPSRGGVRGEAAAEHASTSHASPEPTNGHPLHAFTPQLGWNLEEMGHAARMCNGCGACRSISHEVRMCPVFHINPREEASPRAKANLIRGLLTGSLPNDILVQDASKEVADLCFHCHMCRIECPANVDVPKMMLEAKATYVQTNGLNLTDWLLTRIDMLASIAGRFPGIANWVLKNPQARWLLEKTTGIAQGRKLPPLSRRSFLQHAALRRLHNRPRTSGEKVVYFVDTYANHFDTQLADAFVAILRHNRVAVFVPKDQQQAGMPMIAAGAIDPAREVAEQNVALLAEYVRQGFTIVATEPSAVLALTHEYPIILNDDEDALAVAQHTQEACHYLWQLHQRGRLRLDFRPQRLAIGYHVPCHLRALGIGAPAENLLRLVPGIRVHRIEKGCSGMAGLWGAKHDNYRASLRIGLDLINAVRNGPFQVGMTECSTCKMQIDQSSRKPTLHPLKLFAHAYALMPEIEQIIHPPSPDWPL